MNAKSVIAVMTSLTHKNLVPLANFKTKQNKPLVNNVRLVNIKTWLVSRIVKYCQRVQGALPENKKNIHPIYVL
jgi:hypothetical protein